MDNRSIALDKASDRAFRVSNDRARAWLDKRGSLLSSRRAQVRGYRLAFARGRREDVLFDRTVGK